DRGENPEADSLTITGSDQVKILLQPAKAELLPDGVAVRKIPFNIHLKAGAVSGPVTGFVSVVWDSNGVKRDIRLPVDWNVRTFYQVTPGRAFFSQAEIEKGNLERRIAVRRTDGEAFSIQDLKVTDPAIKISSEKGNRKAVEHRFTLRLDPKSMPDSVLWGEVQVVTDDPVQSLVKIPFAALNKQASN